MSKTSCKALICALAILCAASIARASGYNEYDLANWATNANGIVAECTGTNTPYTGCNGSGTQDGTLIGCSVTGGTYNGLSVPQCSTTHTGSFDVPGWIMSNATNGQSIQLANLAVQNVSGVSTGKLCMAVKYYAQPALSIATTNLHGATGSGGNGGVDFSGASPNQISDQAQGFGTFFSYSPYVFNMNTAANCASTTCTNVLYWTRIIVYGTTDCNALITSGSVVTGKSFNILGFENIIP